MSQWHSDDRHSNRLIAALPAVVHGLVHVIDTLLVPPMPLQPTY